MLTRKLKNEETRSQPGCYDPRMPFDASLLTPADLERFRPGPANPDTGCYVAIGAALYESGEARVYVPSLRRNIGAHRIAWSLANGPIPDDAKLLHRCPGANTTAPSPARACCNPAHLELVTA